MSPTEAAVRFALSHASVRFAIVGFSTPGQVDQAVEWTSRGPLNDSLIASLLAKTA
jgi:aryl-alcohol dehydrogenase-like predicted oxidoreductase